MIPSFLPMTIYVPLYPWSAIRATGNIEGLQRKIRQKIGKRKAPGAFPFRGFAAGAVFLPDKTISGGTDGFP
jgi:hypothetical protein